MRIAEEIELYRKALKALRQAEAILITERALKANSPQLENALAKTRTAITTFTEMLKRWE